MAKWFLVLAGCLAACQSQPVALDDFGAAQAEAQCSHLVSCGQLRSTAECARAFRTFPTSPHDSLHEAVAQGKVRYDGDAARRCVDAIAGDTCDDKGSFLRRPDACWAAVRGTVGNGGACAIDAECTSQRCAVQACGQACCPGTCLGDRAPGAGATGDRCMGPGDCHIGLYCAGGACTPQLALGARCSSPDSCGDGLVCLDVCTPLPGIGEPCDGICRDIGATCSGGTCIKLGLSGDSCDPDHECSGYYGCDATSRCSLDAGLPPGAPCQARELCAGPAGACMVPPGSSTGTCKQIVVEGEPCDENRLCASGTCNPASHTCDPPPVCT